MFMWPSLVEFFSFKVGRIVVSQALDREAVSEYLVVVIARDSAEASQEVWVLTLKK